MSRAKFNDGQIAKTQMVSLSIDSDRLMIHDEITREIIDIWPVSDLLFDPRLPNVPVLMSRHEPDARLELVDLDILPKLKALKPELKFEKVGYRYVAVLVGLLIGILIGFFYSLPTVSLFLAKKVPFSFEKDTARKLSFEKHFKTCDLTESQTATLAKLVASVYPALPTDDQFQIDVKIHDDQMVNAFALPGGMILLNVGLLRAAMTPDEIVGVLAHEIAHVSERHVLQGIVQKTFLTSAINFIGGDVSGILLLDPSTILSIAALKYDRNLESEADQLAIERLVLKQVDLTGYKNFFVGNRERMALPEPLSLISTHPGDQSRIKLIDSNIVRVKEPISILSDEEFEDLKKACPVSLPSKESKDKLESSIETTPKKE